MSIIVRNSSQLVSPGGVFSLFSPWQQGDVSTGPMTVTIERPTERVLLDAPHDPNPFALFASMLWALSGTNELAMLLPFAPGSLSQSSDGRTMHAAIGYRWRHLFGVDQLARAISTLRNGAPTMLGIWAPQIDVPGEDVTSGRLPNEIGMHLYQEDGRLHGHVFAHHARVPFDVAGAGNIRNSAALELVAAGLGVPVGHLHYTASAMTMTAAEFEAVRASTGEMEAEYASGRGQEVLEALRRIPVEPFPLLDNDDIGSWLGELEMFCELGPVPNMRHPFFRRVAAPIMLAWREYRTGKGSARYQEAGAALAGCLASDWAHACTAWLVKQSKSEQTTTKSNLL